MLSNPRILIPVIDKWEIPQIVLDNSTEDELKFIFDQAKDRVKETADQGDSLYSKSLGIIGGCLTAIIALIGFLITTSEKSPEAVVLSVVLIFYLIIVTRRLKDNIFPNRYYSIGSPPKLLLTEAFYKDLDGKTSSWYFLINEIRQYQKRIVTNDDLNISRTGRIKTAYSWLYAIPFVMVGSYLIFILLCSLV